MKLCKLIGPDQVWRKLTLWLIPIKTITDIIRQVALYQQKRQMILLRLTAISPAQNDSMMRMR